jgi:hypothetical protein
MTRFYNLCLWHCVQIPHRLVVGREILTTSTRSVASTYSLTERRYLGPTSMDHELSFIMCSLGRVHKGFLVYDPFAGETVLLCTSNDHNFTMNHSVFFFVLKLLLSWSPFVSLSPQCQLLAATHVAKSRLIQ